MNILKMICFLKIAVICDLGQRTQFLPGTQFLNLLLEENVYSSRPGAVFIDSALELRTVTLMWQGSKNNLLNWFLSWSGEVLIRCFTEIYSRSRSYNIILEEQL